MKRAGILHPGLSRAIAEMGHGDGLVVADAGLPIPPGVERFDLAFAPGRPGFLEVLEAVLGELEVERAVVAAELFEVAPAAFAERVRQRLQALPKVGARGPEAVPHEDFKRLVAGARAVVRTGELTPYANVLLRSGVIF